MSTYYSYTATGSSGDDTFSISGESAWQSFRSKSVNGSSGTDIFQVIDTKNELRNFSVSATNGIATISTSSAMVYLTGFEKVTYNGVTKWESTSATTPTTPSTPTVTSPSAGNDTVTGTAKADLLNGLAGNDTVTGLAGNDTLDGGTGADSMLGGLGNDTYVVDNSGDLVTESANQGTDLVKSSISYTLTSNVENLTLTGTSQINGTGNELANTITGNTGNNQLDGGSGKDVLIGGQGNDSYVVDNAGDKITEKLNEGTDTVQVAITAAGTKYTLGANVENGIITSSSAMNLSGNALNNVLTGNAASNTLNGMAGNDTLIGGLGKDILTGGAGNDTFRFETVFSSMDVDTVTDFVTGVDKISLNASLVAPLGGAVDGTELWLKTATTTQSATQYLIYDKTTGILAYDADGSGTETAVTIALIGTTKHPTLTYSDFVIV